MRVRACTHARGPACLPAGQPACLHTRTRTCLHAARNQTGAEQTAPQPASWGHSGCKRGRAQQRTPPNGARARGLYSSLAETRHAVHARLTRLRVALTASAACLAPSTIRASPPLDRRAWDNTLPGEARPALRRVWRTARRRGQLNPMCGNCSTTSNGWRSRAWPAGARPNARQRHRRQLYI